ncbi:ABC transporter permease subunit [Aerococcus agrisoli]|uniref:ABC transporter permease subunit n=1 Tax=Aerococcus agrisoli TaxID=2487350 RepID=A0A3N4GA27_9LACT|nr:ABC transporter permease subunit [Aerococcus agrisoli]RPA59105.1 ABC transporter permease subunit [Aerococcus agrisoli]
MKKIQMKTFVLSSLVVLLTWFGFNVNQVEAAEDTSGETYVIGLDDTFAPMGFRDADGNIVGFDIDLAEAVADLYGWELEYQPIDWAMKETELNSGNIDMIWNGYGITPEREEMVLFSEPYIESGQVVISKKGSGIEQISDLVDKTIATQSGSTALTFMQEWPDDTYSKLASEPVLYPSYNEVFADLDADRVDAVYAGEIYSRYTLTQKGTLEDYQMFTDETSIEPMGVGFRKEDTALKTQVDEGIQTLRDNGTYDEIYTKWFGEDAAATEKTNIVLAVLPSLLNGLKLTLLLFVVVSVISIPIGFLIGVLRVFGPKWLQAIIEAYVFIMRGSPLMLQLMVIFFGLPYIGISLDRFTAAVLAYVINYAAYYAEIFRGGISAVPDGQYESISVLGIGKVRGFRRIILPQVIKIVMPSMGNEIISLVKDTSLVYVIGLGEMLRAGNIAANTYASLVPYLVAGAIYLLVTAILTFALRRVEKQLKW